MNKLELSQLLTIISAVDNRIVSPSTVEAWWPIVGHLPFEFALDGARLHQRESTDYLQPAHVVSGARRARDIRDREARKSRPQIESQVVTLDRARFEADTLAAIETARAAKQVSA